MKHTILCINSGSSSIKFALYHVQETEELIAEGAAERIGLSGGWLWLKDSQGKRLVDSHSDYSDHKEAVKAMVDTAIEGQHLPTPDAVGHRLVHGGPKHMTPEMVTPELMLTLRGLTPLAPLHLPGKIKGIDAVAQHYPGLSQVVCFDTAFHRRIPGVGILLQLEEESKEIGYGQWEGKTPEDVNCEFHDDYVRWLAEPGWNAPPGGERGIDIARRSSLVLEEIEKSY